MIAPARSGPDLILHGGRVHTVDADDHTAEAVAIRGRHILAVGSSKTIRALADPATRIVDLGGLTVIPGFVDGHPHMDGVGMRVLRPSFDGAKSVEDIQAVVGAEAARRPAGEWLIFNPIADAPEAFGYPERLREGRWPSRADLDAVAPGHPVLIRAPMMVAPGVAVASSRALELARIGTDTRAPEGVEIERDERGEPTGRLRELNFPPVIERALFPMLPPPSHADWVRAVRAGARAFNAAGVTAIYEGHGIPAAPQQAYLDLWEQRELTVRTYFVIAYPVPLYRDPVAGEALIRATAPYAAGRGFGDDTLRFGGLGFSFDSATAIGASRMREPYVGARGHAWTGIQHA
ncbi:MAG: amidohydrolase, partial [Gemmatimonadales bacterium]